MRVVHDFSSCRSYVVEALKTDRSLPYSINSLKALARAERGSWLRHGEWILRQERQMLQVQHIRRVRVPQGGTDSQ